MDKYFWRQLYIVTPGVLHTIGLGLMLAFPSSINPALLNPDDTDLKATPDQASWIASIIGVSGMFAFFIHSPLMQFCGRKPTHLAICSSLLISWFLTYFATGLAMLYLARMFQGLTFGYINQIIVGEYCSPKRRGYFITLKKIASIFGSLLCHYMTLHWTWRQVALFSIAPSAIAVVMTLFWPESPAFLAYHGKFIESEKTFYWLNKKSIESEIELKTMFTAQLERISLEKSERKTNFISSLMKQVMRRDFQKPFWISALLTMMIDACGKFYFVAYIVQMMKKLLGDDSIAVYCSIGADVLTISALMISVIAVKKFNRRTLLFSIGAPTVVLMFSITILEIFNSKFNFLVGKLIWITPAIVILLSFIVNIGIVPVCFILMSEIFPLEHRALGVCGVVIVFSACYSITIKLTPILMDATGMGGTFGVFGCTNLVCLLILYFVLPETKDKSLQEIEDQIRGIDRNNHDSKLTTKERAEKLLA